MVKKKDGPPIPARPPSSGAVSNEDIQAMVAAVMKAEINAAMSLNTGPITGVNYQSVLPMGMVILLTVIVLSQTASNSLDDWFLHRQQMLRLKQNGAKSACH